MCIGNNIQQMYICTDAATVCGVVVHQWCVRDVQARDRGFDPRLRWIGFAVKADFRRLQSGSAPLRENVSNALPVRWQSHPGENICDVSMVSLVARWPVFDLRICSRTTKPIMLLHFAPRQGTLLTRALSWARSKWVPGRTVKACVFE